MIIIILLILSIIEGFLWLTKASSSSTLYYSIIINIFWAIYQIPFLIGGIILAKMMSRRENYVEVAFNRD